MQARAQPGVGTRSATRNGAPDKRQFAWIWRAVWLACLLPLLLLVADALRDALGANPIEFITRATGDWTLRMLLLTLAVTPLRHLTGWHWLVRLRRTLGLYAFFYGCLHLTTYLWLDQFFDAGSIIKDIIKRPFITTGFAAFTLMLPLAATSTNGMIRRLGGRLWQRLHRLVYAVGVLGVAHYWWLVKKDITEPLIYATILAALFALRIWHARRMHRTLHAQTA
ncbi:MAG: sulfoxide reductase heme-binding subunit YedZ [Gammaproteobacteria bacterium]|jgi:methionine sulfoxide reductase heme-binding subunit|nr:sulfoxide reductase heme-binding subunit YedZ [Gammaproteobacteria bacterium]MBU0858228.1 sulfoxide reductase heme-binding subunit YedZ [Gammaproteobacteria bacterium]MBU1846530.1 sulfoxide reductase heme-binding subunit YedZ [Gammaproteobacteria bacterium]